MKETETREGDPKRAASIPQSHCGPDELLRDLVTKDLIRAISAMCAAFLKPKLLPDYTEGDPVSGILPIPKRFKESDPYVQWIKNPHTISFLIGAGAILIYVAFTRDDSNLVQNVK